jgi:predicted nucleic acid-binding protein
MSGVVVDTSVWVEHFRLRSDSFMGLLELDLVLMHSMVLGEIFCGTPPDRARSLAYVELLKQPQEASMREVMDFVGREKLFGLGCGLVDMHLLASTLMTPGASLWTLDKRLAALAERFNVMYKLLLH